MLVKVAEARKAVVGCSAAVVGVGEGQNTDYGRASHCPFSAGSITTIGGPHEARMKSVATTRDISQALASSPTAQLEPAACCSNAPMSASDPFVLSTVGSS